MQAVLLERRMARLSNAESGGAFAPISFMAIDVNSPESGLDNSDFNNESDIAKETISSIENNDLSNDSMNAVDSENQTERQTDIDQTSDSIDISEKDIANNDDISNDNADTDHNEQDIDANIDDENDSVLSYDTEKETGPNNISREETQKPEDDQKAVDNSFNEDTEGMTDVDAPNATNKDDKNTLDENRQNIDSAWVEEVQENEPVIAEAQPSNNTIRTDAKFERTPEAEADQSTFFDLDAAQQAEAQIEKPENENTGDIEKEMHPGRSEGDVEEGKDEKQDVISENTELKTADFIQDAHDAIEISEDPIDKADEKDTSSPDIESTRNIDSDISNREEVSENQGNTNDFDNTQDADNTETASDADDVHISAQADEDGKSPDTDLSEMYSLASDTAREQAAAYLGTDNEDGQSTVTMDDVLSAPVETAFTDYAGEVRDDATLSDLVAALNAFGEEAGVPDMGYDAFKDGVSSYQASNPDASPDVLNSLVVDVGKDMEIIDPGLDGNMDTDKVDSDSFETLSDVHMSDVNIDSEDFVGNDTAENSLENFKTDTEGFINQDPAFIEENSNDNVDQGLDNDTPDSTNNDFNKPDIDAAQDIDSDLSLQDFMSDNSDFDWSDFDSDNFQNE